MNQAMDALDSGLSTVALEAYCERVGYSGLRQATVESLHALHGAHTRAIAFEAIDVLLGRPIELELSVLVSKLIAGGRGGYCFEQNLLFRQALIAFGFQVETLIARSRWGRPLAEFRPRTHMALRVLCEGEEWLADVGSPRALLGQPIRMNERGPQPGIAEAVRLIPVDAELRLEAEGSQGWRPVYDLVLAPQVDAELVAANWFVSTHPTSPFRQALIVSRATTDGRVTLLENRLTIRRKGRADEQHRLSADELARSLAEDFRLAVAPTWADALNQAVERGDRLELRS